MPNDDDMGFNDPENLLWVNMMDPYLGGRFKDRIDELESILQLTHQLATIHAGIQVMQRKAEGTLPKDDSNLSRWKRSQYRARVLEAYFRDGVYPWLWSPQQNIVSRNVQVEKSQFHWTLLYNMLSGVVIPPPLAAPLERIFKGVADTVSATEFMPKQQYFWGMLQGLTYDEIRDDIRISFRSITYTLDQEMYKTIKGKDSQSEINVEYNLVKLTLSSTKRNGKCAKLTSNNTSRILALVISGTWFPLQSDCHRATLIDGRMP